MEKDKKNVKGNAEKRRNGNAVSGGKSAVKNTEKTRYRTAKSKGNSGEKFADGIGKNAEKFADKVGKKIAKEVVGTTEKFADGANKKAEKFADGIGKNAEKFADKVGKKIAKEVVGTTEKFANEANKKAEKFADGVGKKIAKEVVGTTEKFADEANKKAEKFADEANKKTGKFSDGVNKKAEKFADGVGEKNAKKVVRAGEKFAETDEKSYYEDIVKDVFSDFLKRREERKNFELQWRLNMNFFMGNQFSEITPDGDIGDGSKLYHWQEREVFNHIAPIIETRLARLSNVKPNVNVRPATGFDDDINTAKFAARIVASVFSKTEIESVINEGAAWADICGSCFYKIGWNTQKGAVAAQRPDGSYIYEGEVEITACPPFEIYPDNLNASNMNGLKSIIHAKAYTVAQIKEIWGEDVEPADVNAFSADNSLSAGGLGYTASIRKIAFEKKENSAYVVERYTAPSPEFPNGLLSIVAGNKLLYHGALPYLNNFSENVFPFIRQTAIDQAGFFFGISVIERLIPVQRAYNAVRNRKHEFLNRIAMGVLAVEDGSVDTDNLENEGLSPGKILVYRQGSAPPHMLDMSRVPGDFNYEEEKLMNEFVVISGISEITRYSKVPSNVTSGIALSLLIEQDETRLNITARNIKSAIKNIGICIVGLYKMFANERRLKGLAKESDDILLYSFNLGKISRDDIVIEGDNDMMDTPANRRGMVVDLLKLGLLADENGGLSDRTRFKALEMLGLGNWENSKDLDELHLKKASKENKTLSESYIAADKIDDHKLHIDEHIKIAVGIFGDDEKKKRFERHIEGHRAFLKDEESRTDGASTKGIGKIDALNLQGTDLENAFASNESLG